MGSDVINQLKEGLLLSVKKNKKSVEKVRKRLNLLGKVMMKRGLPAEGY